VWTRKQNEGDFKSFLYFLDSISVSVLILSMAQTLKITKISVRSDVEKALKLNNLLQGEGFDKIRSQFVKSLKLKDGKVVHMLYATVKGILSEEDFFSLLAVLGIPAHSFFAWKDRKCGTPGFPNSCGVSPGDYCDTILCSGH